MSTPEQDRENRKIQLKKAREKLSQRKKEREALRIARAQRGLGNPSDSKEDYGQKYVDDFLTELDVSSKNTKKTIMSLSSPLNDNNKKKNDSNNNQTSYNTINSLFRAPGRKSTLSTSPLLSHRYQKKRRVDSFNKETSTDTHFFYSNLRENYPSEFNIQSEISKSVKANLMESPLKFGYPINLWKKEMLKWDISVYSNNNSDQTTLEEQEQRRLNDRFRVQREQELALKEVQRKRREEKERKKKEKLALTLLPSEESKRIINNGDFLENFRIKSRWMERTLGINEYFNLDYHKNEEQKYDKKERKELLFKRKTFMMESMKGRAVSDIKFSSMNRDWFLSSYYKNIEETFSSDSDGCILIWNLILPKYPEYTLYSQTMITSTYFHPSDPFLIFGATVSGQILLWDVRNNKNVPISRTNFSDGHSAPIFELDFLPNVNNKIHHLLSVSNDGKLCIWRHDQLSEKPLNSVILNENNDTTIDSQKTLQTTCFSFPSRDSGSLILGSDEGCLYKAEIYNQSQPDSLPIKESIKAHYGPITNVDFHPLSKLNKEIKISENISGLYLTSSYDWSVKLWHNKKNNEPIAVYNQMSDYVYDVKWSKGGKPGVFATADGEGKVNVFDLSKDFKEPISIPIQVCSNNESALTKIEWGYNGKYLCCGDSEGCITLYLSDNSLTNPINSDFDQFDNALKRNIKEM